MRGIERANTHTIPTQSTGVGIFWGGCRGEAEKGERQKTHARCWSALQK